MSVVTNLIIACSTSENTDYLLKELNRFNYMNKNFIIVSVKDKKLPVGWYGGDKILECNLFIGSYNHLPLDDFVKYLKESVEWEDIDTVQLIVKGKSDDRFRIINLVENI